MTDNLENLAIEELAITNPTAYINSNPSPREWTMTPQDVARSLKLTAEDIKSLTQNKKDSWLGSLGRGVGEGIMGGLETISRTGAVEGLKHTYTSPNMTREEAIRLLQDAEYTSHFLRNKKAADSAKTLKYQFPYGFGNAIGSMIELVGVGFTTGVPGVMATVGSQSRSLVEETLVDTFVEKTGGIEGYTEEQKSKETLLANAYGVFSGLTEMLFGVEKLAGGAINGLTKANALSRLARSQGKLTKSALIKYGAQAGKSALGEATEEFIQNFGEDVIIAMAGHADTLTWDGVLKKALTGAMYGALVGGPVGMGLYRYNRKSIIDRIKKWSEEKELGLEEGQVVNIADSILDDSRSTIVDEIATRAEIKNKYGQAYETLKVRIGEQIDATGTTPWTDKNKSKEEYIDTVAKTLTLPAVVQANIAGLPLSEFLDIANIQIINNVLHLEPVTDINQLQTLLDQQNDIIAEQNRLAKLNNDDPAAKQKAQRRKAILQNAIRGIQLKNGIQTAARTRRKANADYITAQQLAPEQMGTIDAAVEAQEGQEYVLFGGKKIPVEYQVVELADLQPSHINGTVNPNYSNKELQNRASRGTVQDVADLREKGQNITPERLLRGMTSAEGAPITNAQNEVIAGNGRTEIIRVAYENPETAARYRSALEKAGFSTEGMNQPVLIRKNTTMTTAEQVAAADISNISETSAFDEASQAKRDTQYLKNSADALEFASKLPMSERRGLMLNNGKWNMRKVQQRYEDALLSWICGNDTQLFEELVLNRGLTQKVIDVLTSNGATIYSLQETYPDTEIRQDIYNALVKMQRATRDNFLDITQTVELDGHDPMIENTLVWGFLYTNRSGNNLIMKNYATTLQENHQAVNNGADMFGNTVAPLSKKDAMIQALQAADEASAQMAADRGREYEGLFTETGEIKNAELAAAVASYQNQFAGQDETTLFQLGYTSGSTYYERPSTAFVLLGGEGEIVHGWGMYLLASQLKNEKNYRRKFSRPFVFVRNFPEINTTGSKYNLNGRETELFEDFKRLFKSSHQLQNLIQLLSDDLVPGSTEAKFFNGLFSDRKYTTRQEHVEGQSRRVYWTINAPRNAHPWVKDFVKRINKKVKQAVKEGGETNLTPIMNDMLKHSRGPEFNQFLRDMFQKSEIYNTYSKDFVEKAIAFLNERFNSDEFGVIDFETPIMITPWQGISPMDTQRVLETLNEIQSAAQTVDGILPKYRMYQDNNRVINLYALMMLESYLEDTYPFDIGRLEAILQGQIDAEEALKDDKRFSSYLRKILSMARDMRADLKNSGIIDISDPVAFMAEVMGSDSADTELNELLMAIYPDVVKPTNPAAEFMKNTNPIMRDEVMKMLKTGKLEIDYRTDNKALFKDTKATAIDTKKPRFVRNLANEIRAVVDKKPLDDVIYRFADLYRGLDGLVAFTHTAYYMDHPIAELIRDISKGKITFADIEENDVFQSLMAHNKTKPTYSNFVRSLLEDAIAIYEADKTEPGNEDTDTWAAISKALQNMSPKTRQIFQTAMVNTETDAKMADTDLAIEMIQRPDWVKRTRAQQLEVEIPENEDLLDQDKPLIEQPSKKLIELALDNYYILRNAADYVDEGLFPAFAAKHKLPYDNAIDFVNDIYERTLNDKDTTKLHKLAKQFIMENQTGKMFFHALGEALTGGKTITLKSGEVIGMPKEDEYERDETPSKSVMGKWYTIEHARDISMWLHDLGFKGITYMGGEDGRGFVIFDDKYVETMRRIDDERPIYYQKGRGKPMGWYDPELQAIVLGKNWNETTIVHEFHHRYLEKIWGIYKEAQAGVRTVNQAWIEETEKLFEMLGIDPTQDQITVEQHDQFATMVEAYITGLGVEKPETQAFTDFLNWVPEKYKSTMNIGYLDKDGNIKNPILDEQSVAFFNRWFGNPALPSLPTAPDAQRMVNPTDDRDEIIPSTQKEMNNREKEWGQDSEEQSKADAQLWRAIGENTPTDMRAAVDAEEAIMKEEAKGLPDDRALPEEKKQTLRDRWFKTYQPDARERAAEMARKYVKENPEHARELAFADPEIETEYDAPVDRGMLIRAVMETTAKGSDEWYILDNNLAVVKSMSASTLSLSGDISHRAYLDAKREVEDARELKAAVNYAGTTRGAMDKWNSDIRDFISKRVGKIIATEANSEERKLAIKAFIEEAKTKFSGNTTNAILNQLDLTGYKTKSQQAFIKWAEKQIKQAAHAHIDAKEQAELMKASIKAQLAMTEIDSAQQDVNGNFARATAAGKDLRHWQFVKDKMKKAYIGRWGRFGIFIDNLFGSYAPSALLMSINTLFVANIPSTSINNSIVKSSAQKIYGKNAVDKKVIENEKKRIKQIFNASGINLAQMEKPTSPSVLHGEKYTQQEQSHWYDFVFKTLGWGDNLFRIPTFVDILARIASKNANGDSAKATKLFREYTQINNASDEAKIARKQALAVANMGVFTQEGILASNLNHIRSSINKLSRGLIGLGPDGYGLGNLLAPFLKTGANVVEMGIRGSIAPVLQITTWAKKMQGKEITDLDKIALRVDWKYFAYTAVAMALFAALSNDDDDWYEEPYQTGHRYDPNKPYDSIKIGNAWIKLDIFGPFAIPIRVAARIIQRWEDGALTAIANGYGFGASEALSDLPLANQVTDNSMSYMAKQPGKWATGFLYNQANKLVPAQLKSIARAGSRATDAELDVSDLGQTIERKFHRNYGFDGEELTTNDIINLFTNRLKWGEE